eukprot:m.121385 g.121385  ORF g.121385 m.121385 type:complete len:262 (+) comp16202_c0_seq1:123-908(+)
MELRGSGAVLALAYQSMWNSEGDLEGLLLGSQSTISQMSVNDTVEAAQKNRVAIELASFVPSGRPFSLYNNSFELDMQAIKDLLGPRIENVVGWFKMRRNTPARPTYNETQVHSAMQRQFANSGREIVFALFTEESAVNGACHTFRYAFFRAPQGKRPFERVALTVGNLDRRHTEYDLATQQHQHRLAAESSALTSAITLLRTGLDEASMKSGAAAALEATHEAALRELSSMTEDLHASEQRLRDMVERERRFKEENASLI